MMKKAFISLAAGMLAVMALTCFTPQPAAAQNIPVQRNPILLHEEHHDVSAPLRDMIKNMPRTYLEHRMMGEPGQGRPPIAGAPDGAVQHLELARFPSLINLNFAGVGEGDYGFQDCCVPPDTNASVGDTQVVQWVNLSFAIFDKSNGSLISGPTAGNAFWSGFGGGCETQNAGDIVIKYDQLANRWVAAQPAFDNTPYLYCIAVSTSDDATGTYNRYSISFGNVNFNDYPKLGVWPDAYYTSFNIFGNTFFDEACALDRTSMLNGQAMRATPCFTNANEASWLPSDVDGSGIAQSGEPAFYVDLFDSTHLHEYQFHVDFTNPSNSTFTGPIPITVASYTGACDGGNIYCIPQPSGGEALDSLADRLMFRLAYRNFSNHESLLVSHSVVSGNGQASALRWYEIQNPNSNSPVVAQQGTYGVAQAALWMSSIASDKNGNFAIGFSASNSSNLNPSIGVTGRLASDPLGTLRSIVPVIKGGGVQESSFDRWGDYSSMALDPSNDCTFWYTQEYIKSTGSFNWSTQIASFKIPSCN
jgi:hypothetical protein